MTLKKLVVLCLLLIYICSISTALAEVEVRIFEKEVEVEETVGRSQRQEEVSILKNKLSELRSNHERKKFILNKSAREEVEKEIYELEEQIKQLEN
ncbi:MAG: hypothetical protein ABIF87_18315 [Pseudomonadota bacterium]